MISKSGNDKLSWRRQLGYNFWYVLWFFILPLIITFVISYLLNRYDLFDGPWFFLLTFAIVAIFVYSIKERFPWWYDPENYPTLKSIIKHGRQINKDIQKIQKKHSAKLDKTIKDNLTVVYEKIESSIESKDRIRLIEYIKKFDVLIKKDIPFIKRSSLTESIESIVIAVLIALVLRAFIVEAFKIPSGSMIPTLTIGDHLFVNKFVYGFRIPGTKYFLVHFRNPNRGEIIVFIYPQDESKDFIKRVIGLAGDVIEYDNDQVIINGHRIPRCYIGESSHREKNPSTGEVEIVNTRQYIEFLGGYYYRVIYNPLRPFSQNWSGPVTVPENQVFVMGDNRDDSQDSRVWGGVPIQNIKGKALLIWWSSNSYEGFEWGRMGHLVMNSPQLTSEEKTKVRRCAQEQHFRIPRLN